jgi:nucleoside-diphosphate kinase
MSRAEINVERSLVLIKPDAVARRLIGKIISRYEEKGLWIVGMKHMTMTRAIAEAHYAEHKGKPFFGSLVEFMTSSPLVALVVEGPDAISLIRKMNGKTKVADAEPGTIRGDFAASTQQNLIHASDSPESAAREIGIWFSAGELSAHKPCDGKWVTEQL